MTTLALLPKLPNMHVVLHVTRRAFGCELDLVRRLPVATRAGNFAVRAAQDKLGVLGMIEFPNTPAVGRMTVLALRAESALVNIVARMTAIAIARCAFVGAVAMALRTRHGNM